MPAVAYSKPNSTENRIDILLRGAHFLHTPDIRSMLPAQSSMPLRFAARMPLTFDVVMVMVMQPYYFGLSTSTALTITLRYKKLAPS